jgi:cytochrome P450
LLDQRRVVREAPTHQEIESLTKLAQQALADALVEAVSDDGRFDRAYDAARALATAVVRTSGYRVKPQGGGHFNTFLALKAADPNRFSTFAAYFDICREKRNDLNYVAPGIVTRSELAEILREVARFQAVVEDWLADRRE